MTKRIITHACASITLGLLIGFFAANCLTVGSVSSASEQISTASNDLAATSDRLQQPFDHARLTQLFASENLLNASSRSEGVSSEMMPEAFSSHGFTLQGAQQQQDRPAGVARKNIQVLKELPNSQLIPVMNFIGASLGVNCAHCHVRSGDEWLFEKDDKREKLTARKMIQMVLDINRQNFNSQSQVTCYTCHRGQTTPATLPTLPITPPTPPGAAITRPTSEQLPTVEQILGKYVAAIGGRPAFTKLKNRVWKGTQITSDGTSIPLEIYQAAPNKYLTVLMTPRMGTFMTGFDSSTAWIANPRGARTLSGSQLEQAKRAADFFGDLHLQELYPQMTVIGKEKIGEHEVYVIASPVSDKRVEKLYFDTQTGLLLRILALNETMIAWLPEQTDFEDYRTVDGIKLPFMMRLSSVDARSSWTRKFTEVSHNVTIDESKFKMPPPPPPAPTPTPR